MAYYETKQAILEEAGLSNVVLAESLGAGTGSQTIFTTIQKPLMDADYSDTAVAPADVTVYVNGVAVTVSAVNATTGALTLSSAPANGAAVTADYRYTAVGDTYISNARDEAQDLVDTTLGSVDNVPYTTAPATVRKITRLYAAGLLQAKDYGFNANTGETSKDGYKKMAMAEKWLADYALIGGQSGNTASVGAAEVLSDANVFSTYDRSLGRYSDVIGVTPDGNFTTWPGGDN